MVVLLTPACSAESALPPIGVSPIMAIPNDPGPVVNAVQGAAEQETQNYRNVSLLLGTSDALADQRGVINSADVGATCAQTRGACPVRRPHHEQSPGGCE